MSFGMQFTNGDGTIAIDSEYSRLVVISSGRFTTGSDGSGSITSFTRPITTQEPPLVFVKMDRVNGVMGFGYAQVGGVPGNWTGFSMLRYNNNTFPLNGDYFAAAFQSEPTARYGFRLWDASSKLIFDSGTPCAQFTRISSSWAYVSSSTDPQGLSVVYFTTPNNFSAQEFILLNNFGMNVAGASFRSSQIYCNWDFLQNRIVVVTTGVTAMTSLYIPAVFAKKGPP